MIYMSGTAGISVALSMSKTEHVGVVIRHVARNRTDTLTVRDPHASHVIRYIIYIIYDSFTEVTFWLSQPLLRRQLRVLIPSYWFFMVFCEQDKDESV